MAFSRQSVVFDALYGNDGMIAYKRKRVYEHLEKHLNPSSMILELNAGTGTDAIYLAQKGHSVMATDISESMLAQLQQKIIACKLQNRIITQQCSFTKLNDLHISQKFNHIFSNFAGLNCTSELATVLKSFKNIIAENGKVTLVLLPKFCFWETLLLSRGKFKTAFRRWAGKKGTKAHIENIHFRCWYYNPSFVKKILKDDFACVALEGLCVAVPPSYIQNFDKKHSALFKWLGAIENKIKNLWPFRSIGDYYIITFEKKTH